MNRRNFLAAAVAAAGAAALPALPVAVAAALPAAVNSAEFWADSQPHKMMPYMARWDDLATGCVKWASRTVALPLHEVPRFTEMTRNYLWNETTRQWEPWSTVMVGEAAVDSKVILQQSECLPIQ